MSYLAKGFFKNRHINTCYPTLFRKVAVQFQRERMELSDGDFLDIDWIRNKNSRVLVLCHGLEGSTKSRYIQGMAKYFSERGWDILAVNYRGCSGELNRKPFFYHSGLIGDLEEVLNRTAEYEKVVLAGFSLGANLILRYLGLRENYPPNLERAVAVSPPCDLQSSTRSMLKIENMIYNIYFLRRLKKKITLKHQCFPKEIDLEGVLKARNLYELDDCFTAKMFGFKNADDYYIKSSSKPHLKNIKIPTLILTPKDDPIMGPECYPYKEADVNPFLTLETPEFGGHVGFSTLKHYPYWHEIRIFEFFNS